MKMSLNEKSVYGVFTLILVLLAGCSRKVTVSEEYPPTFTFSDRDYAQFYVDGPYTEDELKIMRQIKNDEERKKAIPGDRRVWQLNPASSTHYPHGSQTYSITYGIVPDGMSQVYPEGNKKPMPLQEGGYYKISAPIVVEGAPFETPLFVIRGGKTISVKPPAK